MQYLTSRQDVVKSLYANRQPRKACEDRPANGPIVHRPTARFRETILISLNENSDMQRHETSFSRLPKGETVEIDLEEDHAVDLLLARHQCRIVLGDRLLFVDQRGRDSELRVGRNVVGREATSDVIMDASLRDVSRKHLIVESDGDLRRTCLPAAKIAALSRLDDDELLREAEATHAVEQRFAQTLSDTVDGVVSVGPFLEAMCSSSISQDNSWRSMLILRTSVGIELTMVIIDEDEAARLRAAERARFDAITVDEFPAQAFDRDSRAES